MRAYRTNPTDHVSHLPAMRIGIDNTTTIPCFVKAGRGRMGKGGGLERGPETEVGRS